MGKTLEWNHCLINISVVPLRDSHAVDVVTWGLAFSSHPYHLAEVEGDMEITDTHKPFEVGQAADLVAVPSKPRTSVISIC